MKENLQLIVARRRNHQTRHMQEFLAKFGLATGLGVVVSDVVEPMYSVQAERALDSIVQQNLSSGLLSRSSELLWAEVEDRLHDCSEAVKGRPLILSLCHYNDFMIRLRFCDVLKHGKQILEFDGDTAYFFIEDLSHGIGLDVYKSEISHDVRYTIDLW